MAESLDEVQVEVISVILAIQRIQTDDCALKFNWIEYLFDSLLYKFDSTYITMDNG